MAWPLVEEIVIKLHTSGRHVLDVVHHAIDLLVLEVGHGFHLFPCREVFCPEFREEVAMKEIHVHGSLVKSISWDNAGG